MPTDNISQALKESYAQAGSGDVYVETIEVFRDTADTSPFTGDTVGLIDRFTTITDFEGPEDHLADTGTLTI